VKSAIKPAWHRPLPPFRISFGAGFAALFALVCYFDGSGMAGAIFPAAAIHELAHMGALVAANAPPRALEATITGFRLDYSGELVGISKLVCALAGPVAGLSFAKLCAVCGAALKSDYLLMVAGSSLVLNVFNLLPALPLDGGRALLAALCFALPEATAKRIVKATGVLSALALLGAGVALIGDGMGVALVAAGAWLLVLQIIDRR
jgi:membrane-associated protease RseP (regulator of RpoE activity)